MRESYDKNANSCQELFKSCDLEPLVSEVIGELKKRLGSDKLSLPTEKRKALVLGTLSFEESHRLAESYELLYEGTAYDLLIAASISHSTLAQAALGCPITPEAAHLTQALLLGKPVYLLASGMEYRQYRATAPKALYGLYQHYEDLLTHAGASVLSDLSCLYSHPVNSPDSVSDTSDFTLRRVLTETDVQKARKAGRILIGEHTLITPLAKDYIESHGLTVQRR